MNRQYLTNTFLHPYPTSWLSYYYRHYPRNIYKAQILALQVEEVQKP